jgi:predicted ATPase/signal transduction histidine kinase
LAQNDFSSKFQIPQKLYGRDTEKKTLLNIFDQTAEGKSEIMLIKGYAGVGKSALVSDIQKSIVERRGLFLKVKFDSFKSKIPFDALIDAFAVLIKQLLAANEEQIKEWKTKLLAALGDNGQVIIDVLPDVELIIGKQKAAQKLAPTEAQNRFNILFQRFIAVFASQKHPFTIFLDDLHWIDPASLQLISLFATDSNLKYLFIIGAYRENEIHKEHILVKTLAKIEEEIKFETLTLDILTEKHFESLLSEMLHAKGPAIDELAKICYKKTQGNPFFLNEFLKSLYEDNILTFIQGKGIWTWNIDVVEQQSINANVAELMTKKLQKLDKTTQKTLQIAACIGNEFDLRVLADISQKTPKSIFITLKEAVEEGLLIPLSGLQEFVDDVDPSEIQYRFLHDRVTQSAYSLLAQDEKNKLSLSIGQILLANTSNEDLDEVLFEVVNHINMGKDLVEGQHLRYHFAELNKKAGQKAKKAIAFESAFTYFKAAIEYLAENSWEANYELTFDLYREYAETAYLTTRFKESDTAFSLILDYAKTDLEKTEIYVMQIRQYENLGKFQEAVDAGLKGLELLGIYFPEKEVEQEQLLHTELQSINAKMTVEQIDSLIDLPLMENQEMKAAVRLLTGLDIPCQWIGKMKLAQICNATTVRISLEYGNMEESPLGYMAHGKYISTAFDAKIGYKLGNLALLLNEKFKNTQYKTKLIFNFTGYLSFRQQPILANIPLLKMGIETSSQIGDIVFGSYCMSIGTQHAIWSGMKIKDIFNSFEPYLVTLKQQKSVIYEVVNIFMHCLLNLQGKTDERLSLSSEKFDEKGHWDTFGANPVMASNYYWVKILTLLIHEEFEEAKKLVLEAEKVDFAVADQLMYMMLNFYYALVFAQIKPKDAAEKKENIKKLERYYQKIVKWAADCPENFESQRALIAAEIARIKGQDLEAITLYQKAIESASDNDLIQNVAFANELLAKFWQQKNNQQYAKIHIGEAHFFYKLWGASKKVTVLEKRHTFLQQNKTFSSFSSQTTSSSASVSFARNTHQTSASTTTAQVLDLSSVIKASQTLSGEIVLANLLKKLMKILIENAGAQKGVLILQDKKQWLIQAQNDLEVDEIKVLEAISIDKKDKNNLPILAQSVINYVIRSSKEVVLNDATKQNDFSNDTYIKTHQPKSLLCMPLIHQNKLTGLLYMENNLTTGAFMPQRLEILNLLSSQVAISIENALLYENLEEKVRERTSELNQTLKKLQSTQSSLVESEKMASLGQLTAGIAHEINNPVNFIYAGINSLKTNLDDIFEVLDLYDEMNTKNTEAKLEEIEELKDEVEYEELIEEIDALTKSIRNGAERTAEIVKGLRTFSRLDEDSLKLADVAENIDSTLVMLTNQLKDKRIKVVKEYDKKAPKIECFPGKLNQVYMNTMVNAIQAMELDGTLTLKVLLLDENRVQVRIQDSGAGMDEETKIKIFEPFFTTKDVGEGTGLGLSISFGIIEKHKGKIEVESELGEGTSFIITLPIKQQS